MDQRRVVGWTAGLLSAASLVANWGTVFYFSMQYDPGSIQLWGPLDSHPAVVFGIVMVLGATTGIIAGTKHSKAWFLLAALNIITFTMELMVS